MAPTQTSCTINEKAPQNYHTFALFDPPKALLNPYFSGGGGTWYVRDRVKLSPFLLAAFCCSKRPMLHRLLLQYLHMRVNLQEAGQETLVQI